MYETPQAGGLSLNPVVTSLDPVATGLQRSLGDTIAQRTFNASPRCLLL